LIREWTKLPIYLKGILRADDALKAASLGIDGVIVSNHGGRQIDGAISSTEALPSIVSAANGNMEVWLDSGIRSGSDVFKCIALARLASDRKAICHGTCLQWRTRHHRLHQQYHVRTRTQHGPIRMPYYQ
jgi:hypothetical protein